ncbi:MHYT domain-containing protein [Isoptericola sp. BMS4]|uniref:MHYT domain-containing protein n=1 Tax=Isoptericola sp. BMS4 TaxID=2527875 RepID=UPI001F0F0ECB|nr:MHYT domain-containing protein [Isoptericola sp. BMS4]
MHHFTYGIITPVLAYVASCVGAATGLSATSRARAATDTRTRAVWLLVGALSIGCTGVWVMHFVAMLGFTVTGMPINYDVPETILSAVLAVVVVAIALFLVGFGGDRPVPLLGGGLVAGVGVAIMHYMGMAAMRMTGHMNYTPWIVAVSIVIALVAATAALWLSVNVKGWLATTGAALIMGAAVSGMHYTGMAALTISGPLGKPSEGTSAVDLLGPLILGIVALTVALVFVVAMWPTESEMRERQAFDERRRRHLERQRARQEEDRERQAASRGF